MSRSMALFLGIGVLLVLLIKWLSIYAEWLWFGSVGYESVYQKKLLTQWFLFFLFGIPFFFILYLPWRKARQIASLFPVPVRSIDLDLDEKAALDKAVERGMKWVALMAAVVGGFVASGRWLQALQFLAASDFGLKDPIFGKEVGFYVFKLPLLRFLAGYVMLGVALALVGAALLFVYDDLIQFTEHGTNVHHRAAPLLLNLGGALLLLVGVRYWLLRFQILFSGRGALYGAGYSDVYGQLPGLWVLILLSLVGGAFLLVSAKRGVIKPLYWCAGALVVGSALFRILLPAAMQAVVVAPNEIEKERRFIRHNIKFTRLAYGLDAFKEEQRAVKPNPSDADLAQSRLTFENVRLWDQRPLLDAYYQLQAIRPYYGFVSVDVDRYLIDGRLRQVAIAARELMPHQEARTWLNLHLEYTHGLGVVVSPVNEDDEGKPVFYVKDIPPSEIRNPKSEIRNIKRPEIYYGEFTKQPSAISHQLSANQSPSQPAAQPASQPESSAPPAATEPPTQPTAQPTRARRVPTLSPARPPSAFAEYVIVKTKKPEVSYRKNYFYQEDGGVPVGGIFRRLAFAARFLDPYILFAEDVTEKSLLLMHRNILDRVRTIAPFLLYDSDPYIVITPQGRLVWILDAYTATSHFPYSTPVPFVGAGLINYLRNSVKVTVDAYNGEVRFYVADPNDPMVQTYLRLFPKLFLDLRDLPEGLKAHLRYPQDLFKRQAFIYGFYHMTDPNIFYNKEDVWEIAKEKFLDVKEPQLVEPYYIVMKPPGEEKERFVLMLPMCPKGKDNMISWLMAHCDKDKYGQVRVFRFPPGELVYGPLQMENRIDQHPDISRQLSLWNQLGSKVLRGNLLVLPVGESLVYIEPIYLLSETNPLPQLRRVVVASAQRVEMAESLNEGIKKVLGELPPQAATTNQQSAIRKPETRQDSAALLRRIKGLVRQIKDARARGDWEAYERALREIERLLEKL